MELTFIDILDILNTSMAQYKKHHESKDYSIFGSFQILLNIHIIITFQISGNLYIVQQFN